MKNVVGLLAILALPGCASIVTGTSHSMALATEPAGATCKLERNGETIGYVNQTPSTAAISKSSRPIAVSCSQASTNMQGTATIEPGFQPWILGNILLGGLIGIIVDVSSGAVATYPASTTVVLNPTPGAAPTASTQPVPTAPAGRPMS